MKRTNRFLILLAALFGLLPVPSFSQDAAGSTVYDSDLTSAQLLSDVMAVTPGETFWLAVHLEPKPGWHTYWQNPGDSGISASIAWTLPEGFEAGPIHWPVPMRIKTGDLTNYGYESDVMLPVPITAPENLATGTSVVFNAKVDWLVCKDICVPETATLALMLQVADDADTTLAGHPPLIEPWLKRIPTAEAIKGEYSVNGDTVTLVVPVTSPVTAADFFPIDDGTIKNSGEIKTEITDGQVRFTAVHGLLPPADPLHVVLALNTAEGMQYRTAELKLTSNVTAATAPETKTAEPVAPDLTLTAALFFAFLGGLILNIMPCVLPILSLKALSLTRQNANARKDGIAYTVGVLATFAGIAAIMIGLQTAGNAIGWGFQLQSPGFVTALIYLMFAMGLGLSGAYVLPSVFSGAGDSLTQKGGATGSFFTGAFAVVVATPCTAPFMAPAIGFALAEPPLAAMLIFLSLGFGMALPFLLIGLFPPLTRILPKPGGWMETFKQFLAFPMYLTAVWLLWVLVKQAGPAGVAVALSGCVLIAFAIWLWKFSGEWHRISKWVLLLLALSGLGFSISIQAGQLSCTSPIEMLEEGITAEYFSEAKLKALRDEGTPVFVNATADWCITCQFNERLALDTSAVKKGFRDNNVTVLVADWTDRDDAISEYLKRFGRRGVPLYVFYPPHGEGMVLPQILTPKIVLDALQKN